MKFNIVFVRILLLFNKMRIYILFYIFLGVHVILVIEEISYLKQNHIIFLLLLDFTIITLNKIFNIFLKIGIVLYFCSPFIICLVI